MLWTVAALLLPLTGVAGGRLQAISRDASAPTIPDRKPFGFGSQVTGGGAPTQNNTYVVDNMMDFRTALELTTPRTIYVKGELKGSQINETTNGDCQLYIDSSRVPEFNFTLYVMALNSTYTDAVKAAETAGEEFEGRNATEYLNLLNRQNVSHNCCTLCSQPLKLAFVLICHRAGGAKPRTSRKAGSRSMQRAT